MNETLNKMRTDEKINKAAIAKAKEAMEKMRTTHDTTLAEMRKLSQLVNNPTDENTQQLRESTQRLDKLRRELTAKEQIVTQQETELQMKEQMIMRLEEERKTIEAQSNTQNQKIQVLENLLKQSHTDVSTLQKRLEVAQESLTETDTSNDQQNLKINQLTNMINQLQRDLNNESSRYKILEEKHESAEQDIAEFTRIMTETKDNLKQEALRDTQTLVAEVEQAKSATAETRRLHQEEMNRAREEYDKAQLEYREKIASLEAQNARLIELQRTAHVAYNKAPNRFNQQLAVQAQQTIEELSKDNEELKLYANSLEGELTAEVAKAAAATMSGGGDDKDNAIVASIDSTTKALRQKSIKMDQQLRQMDDALNNAAAVVKTATSSGYKDIRVDRVTITHQQTQPPLPSNKRPTDSNNAFENDYISTKKHITEQTEQPTITTYQDTNVAFAATTNTSTFSTSNEPTAATSATSTVNEPLTPPTITVDDIQQQPAKTQTLPVHPEQLLPPSQDYTLVATEVLENKASIKKPRRSKIEMKIKELSKTEIRNIVANVLPIQSAEFYNSKIEDKLLYVITPNRRALYAACLLKYVVEQSEFDSLMLEFNESHTALYMALAYTRYLDRENAYRYSVLKHSIDDDYSDRYTLNNDVYYSEPEYELSAKSHNGPTNTQALLQQYNKQNAYVEPSDEALDLYDKLFGNRMTMFYNENLFDELLGIAKQHEADLSTIRRYTFFDYRWHHFAAPTRALRFRFGLNPDNLDPMPATMLYVILHFRIFRLFSALLFQVYDTGNQFTLNKILHLYIVYKNSMTLLDQGIYEQYIRSMFRNTFINWDELIENKTKSLEFFCANTTIKPWAPYKTKLQAFVLNNNGFEDYADLR